MSKIKEHLDEFYGEDADIEQIAEEMEAEDGGE